MAVGIVMIVGMLMLITVEGTAAFWPHDIEAFVMGKARYRVHHPQQGPAFVSRDNSTIVFPANRDAWLTPEGTPPSASAASTREVTVGIAEENPALFAGDSWRVRQADGGLLTALDGRPVTVGEFLQAVPSYLSEAEKQDVPRIKNTWKVEHATKGQVHLSEAGELLIAVSWRNVDGAPMPFDFPAPRRATIVDYRELPELFNGTEWLLADNNDTVVRDKDGTPVRASEYLDQPDRFPSPWGYLDENGKHVPIEVMLGDDRFRDRVLLVGTTRGERAMDIRSLPPNDDGTPVKPYQLSEQPREVLVRQGNQDNGLYTDSDYFRWVRIELPDAEAMKRHNLGTYEEAVIERVRLPGAVTVERLEKGVLTGFITRVTVDGEVVADIATDGRERVWEVFIAEQARLREQYTDRYALEKYDLGAVNFEIKDRDDALKRIRYENEDSRKVYAMLEALNETHQRWQGQEPLPDPKLSEEEYQTLLEAWLETLHPMLDVWMQEAEKLDLTETELTALQRAREIEAQRAEIQALEFGVLRFKVVRMRAAEQNATYEFRTPDGKVATLHLYEVVRAFRPNDKGLAGKLSVYGSRVREFLTDDPRESNTEGGIWPVILGTLVMTLLMCVAVVPFGVIAALYLREYAKQGPIVSAVRIAVNNLAGVPSIVFGIFGLGFFCVMMGGTIDDLFFPELQPAPVFGGGGILWASLTLALLTVPVVIVSTEEALSAVPASQREASLACGASKFQTIWKVILPQALPGVLTGTILAMARGAGEVAPLMLVGAVKYALFPPVDGVAPFVHLERKFMHLGFHIYDVGFQSPNVDNTKPLVFATALVLIALVAVLNVFAINLRNRLRKKYATSAV